MLKIEDITNYSNTCSLDGNCQISLEWSASNPNRVDIWQLEYKLNDGGWQTIFSQTSAKKLEDFKLSLLFIEERFYKFRLRAKDKLKSEWTDWQEFEMDLTNSLIINEIAIVPAVNPENTFDQWIELYNRTDRAIDLTGWSLTAPLKSFKLQGEIPANGYFLLETYEEAVSDIKADQITCFWQFDCALFLRNDKGRIVDEYYLINYATIYNSIRTLYSQEGRTYSLERVSPYASDASGYLAENWKINNGEIFNGLDRNKNQFYATPRSQNSCYQDYTPFIRSIFEDLVLKKSLSPFLFTSDVKVYAPSTLTIEPGVKVMFNPGFTKLTVEGTLKAVGTKEEKIIFTSFKDNPGIGDWYKIHFSNSNNSELEHIIVEYAGKHGLWPGQAAIVVENSSFSIKYSEISNNKTSGISLENSYSTIEDCQIHNHSGHLGKGLELKGGGYSKVLNSTFEENYYGIYTQESNPKISNSTFKRNNYGIYIADGQPQLINPIFGEGDDKNGCDCYPLNKCP